MSDNIPIQVQGECMRILFLSFLLTYSLFAANAAEAAKILGAENRYSSAVVKAQKEKKMLIMVIVKEHCRWCDKMVHRTLSDSTVKKAMENDVTLIVDKDDDFPADFKENFFPSTFFIDAETQKSVYESAGFVGTKCFLNDLNESRKIRDELYK